MVRLPPSAAHWLREARPPPAFTAGSWRLGRSPGLPSLPQPAWLLLCRACGAHGVLTEMVPTEEAEEANVLLGVPGHRPGASGSVPEGTAPPRWQDLRPSPRHLRDVASW